MTTLTFKNDSDANDFASKLLEVHDKTQICYKYEKYCEVEFWWEYATDMMSNDRDDEEEEATKTMNKLFDYLDNNGIKYE